jgi:hypothetical protein
MKKWSLLPRSKALSMWLIPVFSSKSIFFCMPFCFEARSSSYMASTVLISPFLRRYSRTAALMFF